MQPSAVVPPAEPARLAIMDSFYRGPATLIFGAVDIEVDAALFTDVEGPEKPWTGTLRATGDESLWAEFVTDIAQLRLPDGREGYVRIMGSGFGPVEIVGEGGLPS